VVVLARSMQILTPWLIEPLESRFTNIHHGLLPWFEGPPRPGGPPTPE
jgi:formyltetrahydrofolate hydrolase